MKDGHHPSFTRKEQVRFYSDAGRLGWNKGTGRQKELERLCEAAGLPRPSAMTLETRRELIWLLQSPTASKVFKLAADSLYQHEQAFGRGRAAGQAEILRSLRDQAQSELDELEETP